RRQDRGGRVAVQGRRCQQRRLVRGRAVQLGRLARPDIRHEGQAGPVLRLRRRLRLGGGSPARREDRGRRGGCQELLRHGVGHRGRVVAAVGGFGGYAGAVAVYPGGKILAAGRSFVDDTQDSSDFVLVRYTSDGRPDPTFGGDGTVITSFGTGADVANALAVQ